MERSPNVELARRFTEAFNSGDVEAIIAVCDPDIEFHSTFAAVGGALYRGHEGLREWHRDLQEAWLEIRSDPEVYFDLGDRVLAFTVLTGRGRESGIESELSVAALAGIRDNLIVLYQAFIHREDALDGLGVTQDELEPVPP